MKEAEVENAPYSNKKVMKPLSWLQIALRLYNLNCTMRMIINNIFIIVFSIIGLIIPCYYGKIISTITDFKDRSALDIFVACYLTLILAKYILERIKEAYTPSDDELNEKMKLVFLKSVLSKDMEFFDYFRPGEIINRFNEDFQALHSFQPTEIVYFISCLLELFISIFSMAIISPKLFLIHCILFFGNIYSLIHAAKNQSSLYENYTKLSEEGTLLLTETISNIRMVKAFSSEQKEFERLESKINTMTKLNKEMKAGSMWEFKSTFEKVIEIVELWYAGKAVLSGDLEMGLLTSFLMYAKNAQILVEITVWKLFTMMKNGQKCERIFQIIDYEPTMKTCENPKKLDKIEGVIEFRNVTFAYPLQPSVYVLQDFNLKINKGEVVAFVGPSGCGKSTIAALIHRLYDVNSGEVLIDGINVKNFDLESLHSKFGYVSQEFTLFVDTIEKNITYAVKHYTKDELDKAARLSNCHHFITNEDYFPLGYNTLIGEKGQNLSGGQKQRIAIARALIKKANILIFDEATSALDSNSENEVQQAIDLITKKGEITTIIIAHRLSTVKKCNRIIVLKDGNIVEQGNHKELLKMNGEYKALVDKQLEANLARGNSAAIENNGIVAEDKGICIGTYDGKKLYM